MIDSNGSVQIKEIIKLNEDLYYIYVTDYKFSNITGINIFSIAINEKSVGYKSIIAKGEIINEFKFIYAEEHFNAKIRKTRIDALSIDDISFIDNHTGVCLIVYN